MCALSWVTIGVDKMGLLRRIVQWGVKHMSPVDRQDFVRENLGVLPLEARLSPDFGDSESIIALAERITSLMPYSSLCQLIGKRVDELPYSARLEFAARNFEALRSAWQHAKEQGFAENHQKARDVLAVMLAEESVAVPFIQLFVAVFDNIVRDLKGYSIKEADNGQKARRLMEYLTIASIPTVIGPKKLVYSPRSTDTDVLTNLLLRDIFESGAGICSTFTILSNLALYAIGVPTTVALDEKLHSTTAIRNGTSVEIYDAANTVSTGFPAIIHHPQLPGNYWVVKFQEGDAPIKAVQYLHALTRAKPFIESEEYDLARRLLNDADGISPHTAESRVVTHVLRGSIDLERLRKECESANNGRLHDIVMNLFNDYLQSGMIPDSKYLGGEFLEVRAHIRNILYKVAEGDAEKLRSLRNADAALAGLRKSTTPDLYDLCHI